MRAVAGIGLVLTAACATVSTGKGESRLGAFEPGTHADTGRVLLAAGDIAACTDGSALTARILDSISGDIIVPGDVAYPIEGNADPYAVCYAATWGRHKSRTRAVPGNHDMEPAMLKSYFAYFGDAAAPPGGYYSFDVGEWHVLALNSNIPIDSKSEQGRWILADLAAHPRRCTLAFMHHPRFSSGPHRRRPGVDRVFELLASGGVDVLVSGHDHIYERFAPMRPSGARDDSAGVRQFVVGTGGNGLYRIARPRRHSERRQNHVYGVLKLTLRADSYSWEFVPASPTSFRDRGMSPCH